METESGNRVSVIVPAFNRAEYIEQTVNSVLIQDYSNVELIVVDDGSTDGTYEILLRYFEQNKLKLLTHPGRGNRGQSAALNLGLEAASGEYIAILDSDDLFLPGKLSAQVEYLDTHPDVGLVYGMGEGVDGSGRWLYDILSTDHSEPNDANAVLLDCYFHLPVNALVRRLIYEQVGRFEESFRAAQDHDMLVRIAEKTHFGFIPVKFFQYRRHGDSISNNGLRQRWMNGFEIVRRAEARFPYRASTIRKRKALLNFRMAQVCLQENRYIAALGYLLQSGVLDPVRAIKVLTGKEKIR
ncbi:glycosyltransferase [Marinobacter confluentis]|uniref:Glycosyltransferase n=1 Tax=Marinobacter confluentis TaxID=1697557 RepID=A0A4Z1BVT6_9GAMM|nr:glycosyltransferase [Marinobacter confluentis]TGN41519.1 glycosyltransferase [Marinobacter confluentis]